MKKILMVGPVPPPYGGVASVLDDLVHSRLCEEYVFHVFERSEGYPAGHEGSVARNVFRLRRFGLFFKTTAKGGYHLTHIHTSTTTFLKSLMYVLLARIAGTATLLHVHGTDWNVFYEKESGLKRFLKRRGFSFPSRIVVLYSLWAEEIRKLGVGADVTVVRNLAHSADPPDPAQVADARTKLGLEAGNFVVLMVGSVGRRKGVFDILAAIPQVVSRDDSVRFVLAGGEEEPGEMARIMEVVDRERLEPWVRVLGEIERESIPSLLGLADLFLLPSYIEGMPIAILEAMQSRLPIVSTAVGGIPDMIQDGSSGLLIEPGSPDRIAQAVLKLRKDESLRKRLALEGRKTFDEKFEFSRGIEEIRSVYESI